MTRGVETRLDGNTLVVHIPMRFQRRGGRKRIVAPDGSDIVPTSKSQPDGTLVKALARAWRWQKLLDEGSCSIRSIAENEGINASYVSSNSSAGIAGPRYRRSDPRRKHGRRVGPGEVQGVASCELGPAARDRTPIQPMPRGRINRIDRSGCRPWSRPAGYDPGSCCAVRSWSRESTGSQAVQHNVSRAGEPAFCQAWILLRCML